MVSVSHPPTHYGQSTDAAQEFFLRAPLLFVPASQTRTCREQLRASLRRKERQISRDFYGPTLQPSIPLPFPSKLEGCL
jgi:hypothetical protein